MEIGKYWLAVCRYSKEMPGIAVIKYERDPTLRIGECDRDGCYRFLRGGKKRVGPFKK